MATRNIKKYNCSIMICCISNYQFSQCVVSVVLPYIYSHQFNLDMSALYYINTFVSGSVLFHILCHLNEISSLQHGHHKLG